MLLTIIAALAGWAGLTFQAQAATVVDLKLIRAAFFSDACRQQAEALGITRTSDAIAFGPEPDIPTRDLCAYTFAA